MKKYNIRLLGYVIVMAGITNANRVDDYYHPEPNINWLFWSAVFGILIGFGLLWYFQDDKKENRKGYNEFDEIVPADSEEGKRRFDRLLRKSRKERNEKEKQKTSEASE